MIPLSLTISGFLSYRDPVDLDFTTFDLACIAGANGAGKSSLLDAITWVLFGKARKQDDSIINAQSKAAEVGLIFSYEGNIYRVQRTKVRDKTGMLEFQILQPAVSDQRPAISNQQSAVKPGGIASLAARNDVLNAGLPPGTWKTLTEHGLRETDARIQQTLRLDYDTFVNASFFLQGKADQFTQQRPGDRKRILSSILGLEIWESYRQGAAERRKAIEDEITGLDGQLREIQAELSEEDLRKSRLKQLEDDLKRLSAERAAQETLLVNIRKVAATLAEQLKLVESLRRYLDASTRQLDEVEARLATRRAERDSYAALLARAPEIESAHTAWQQRRVELEGLDTLAVRFREHERRLAEPREQIQAARARLEQEQGMLQNQANELGRLQQEEPLIRNQFEAAQLRLAVLEGELVQRREMESRRQALREEWIELRSTIQGREKEQVELVERQQALESIEGALCPLCGQPLSAADRQGLVDSLQGQEQQIHTCLLEWQTRLKDVAAQGEEIKGQVEKMSGIEDALNRQSQEIARLASRLELLTAQQQAWLAGGGRRLEEVDLLLERDQFALEARSQLEQVQAELRQMGYDSQEHERARQAEAAGRSGEAEMRALEKAQAVMEPLEREIQELENQVARLGKEAAERQSEFDQSAVALAASQAQAPDLESAEGALLQLHEKENSLRREVGAAHQLVSVLAGLKARRKAYEAEREDFARQVGLYKQLERAFGKDGVPALLIEQALPQIEAKSNEILDRLSGGNMSVRFITQSAYKEKGRQDLKETLDIQISDSFGTRDYEMFSGGEAFRVNFAIRLALSEVLAQRAGARLQTLVIDEGFGSQDALGRQRLIEAINLVRADFAKILVITHIDELKDAFPNRIEVEKTERGSVVRVI